MDVAIVENNVTDICQTKYISPIIQNHILFKNYITNDEAVINNIRVIINEYEKKNIAFELSIKASIYSLLVMLIRNYVEKILTPKQYDSRNNNLKRFKEIFKYIESNYHKDIPLGKLAAMAFMTQSHFCHTFKNLTGKTFTGYVNCIRLTKAEYFLKSTDISITEIALKVGFNDVNYFCRLFRKNKGISASKSRIIGASADGARLARNYIFPSLF